MGKIALYLIKFYQFVISPYLGRGKCKYHPTCSNYAVEAFTRFRFTTALVLVTWRLLRCNPFSKGGYDPLR